MICTEHNNDDDDDDDDNNMMDVLGCYSKDVRKSIKCLVGDRCDFVLKQMQKAML